MSLFVFMDTIEGPRAPAVKLRREREREGGRKRASESGLPVEV